LVLACLPLGAGEAPASPVLDPARTGTIGWHAEGKDGVVASGKPRSVAAGITMLEKGGNAADAAVATLFCLSVTDYGLFAIGGEIPFIFYDAKSGQVRVLSGVGTAPRDPKTIAWFNEHGIPDRGNLKATPVPGALDLCVTALRRFGTLSLEEVMQPVLALLDNGKQDWHPGLARTFRRLIEAEQRAEGDREAKLIAARDRFYKGDIADELVAWYRKNGGVLTKEDLAAHVTREEDPVRIDYRGYTVCKCDSWTQGPYLLQALRLLEGFDLKQMGHLSADYIHVLAESLKLGFADRDRWYGDPRFADVPLDALLSDQYTVLRRPLIDMQKASSDVRPGDPVNMKALLGKGIYRPGPGGTTTCVVADKWGNLVAATPSANRPYHVATELGIAHGNRLRSLNTTPGHPNRIEPGKRPRITLTPTLVLDMDGKGIIAISVAGGDLQDQTTLNCLLNHIEFGLPPKDAVTAPRFYTGHHQGSFKSNPDRRKTYGQVGGLVLNDTVDAAVRKGLTGRGHKVSTRRGAIAHPVMIRIDRASGTAFAAGDPKAGRHAAAVQVMERRSK